MSGRLADFALHALHLAVIAFSLCGWIWAETRVAHLLLCGLILFSWFVLGPLTGRPGWCWLTGLQQRLWQGQGQAREGTYVGFLFAALTGREPHPRAIAWTSQALLYTCTALSLVLL